MNKTDSAIRLTHVPTGIVVQCQNERSQHQNRATAWKMLRAKMARLEEEKREAEEAERRRIEELEALARVNGTDYETTADASGDFSVPVDLNANTSNTITVVAED